MAEAPTGHVLVFYVPESHLEQVKTAVFGAGAGRIGHYDCCAWQALGQGQYRPLAGSQPFRGEQDRLERVAEVRVEVVCPGDTASGAVEALLAAHPYEMPAYFLLPVTAPF